MYDVRVVIKNYSFIEVECDNSVAREMSDYFAYYVPNYQFMPKYKNGPWDGKIRLFNLHTRELPYGLFGILQKFCKARNYPMTLVSFGHNVEVPGQRSPISDQLLDEFVASIGAPYQPWHFQREGLRYFIEDKRGILLSPTASGKSFMLYLMMRYALEYTDNKVMIIVPYQQLVEQTVLNFREYGFDVDANVHMIYTGKEKVTDKRVVVTTWQSIYKLPTKWFAPYGTVLGDECHTFQAKSLTSIMHKLHNTKYRIGVSGSLDESETHELQLRGHFGEITQLAETKQLQEENILAKLNITMLKLKHNKLASTGFNDAVSLIKDTKKAFKFETDVIISSKKRNTFIRNLALDLKGNTLVLFRRVDDHGQPLYNEIRDKAEKRRKVFLVHGGVKTPVREQIRAIIETQKDAILVASVGTFSTGIDISNIHNIIFASPMRSRVKVLQSIGRGLRQSDDGSPTRLFDLYDDLTTDDHPTPNTTFRHGLKRMSLYKQVGFPYKIVEVELP